MEYVCVYSCNNAPCRGIVMCQVTVCTLSNVIFKITIEFGPINQLHFTEH